MTDPRGRSAPMPDPSPLRDLIRDAGMTVSGLSRASGISRDTIHRWLRGETSPRIDMIRKVADALGVSTAAVDAATARPAKPSDS